MVRIRLVPSNFIRCIQSPDSNCEALSKVTVDGTPNLAIQPQTKALAMVLAVIFVIGMTSG